MTLESGLRVLDFEDVCRQLDTAGKRITRFATVIHNDYIGRTDDPYSSG